MASLRVDVFIVNPWPCITAGARLLCIRVASGDPDEIQLSESPQCLATDGKLQR
jgi:hypothetical protein